MHRSVAWAGVVVRCTAKVLTLVGVRRSSLPELPAAAEDWYVNLLWVDRRKSLLVTHALTAFSAFIPDVRKAHLQPPGPLLAAAITDALAAENLPRDALGDLDRQCARLATTASRRVLGLMNDMAVHIDHAIGDHGGLPGLDTRRLNRQLQRTLHNHHGRYATALDLLHERT